MHSHLEGAAVVLILVAACASPDRSTEPMASGLVTLPVAQTEIGGLDVLCGGVGFLGRVELHGSRSDPALTWITWPDGRRENVVWLPGHSARFDTELEVVRPDGIVVAREGSLAKGGCPMPNGYMVSF